MGKTALATNIAEYVRHRGQRAHAVCEPGNGPAGVGPAHALLARPDRRQQVPQRLPFGRRPQEAGRGVGQAGQGADVHRRHAVPHVHRNRRLCPAAETQGEAGAGGDRLLAVDPARRPARPAPGAGGQDGPASEGVGPRTEDSRALPGPVEPPGGAGQRGASPAAEPSPRVGGRSSRTPTW